MRDVGVSTGGVIADGAIDTKYTQEKGLPIDDAAGVMNTIHTMGGVRYIYVLITSHAHAHAHDL